MEKNNNALAQQTQQGQEASQQIIDKAKMESHQWLNPETWRTMQIVAQTFVQSGAMPKSMNTAPKVIIALQAGKEAGLQPIEAINSFYFVNGKVSMYGEIAISQVLKAGHLIEWGVCNDKTAMIKITRGDNKCSNAVTFTMENAIDKKLNCDNSGKIKPVWAKFPENMLRFKAFHMCARFICPDALHGVPIKEVVEAEYEPIENDQLKEKPITAGNITTGNVKYTGVLKTGMKERPNKVETLETAINKEEDEDVKIEEMPKKEKVIKKIIKKPIVAKKDIKTGGSTNTGGPLSKARDKAIKEEEFGKNQWPEDVCCYLNFITGINDEDLPNDILELKKDAISGIFKGYKAYSSLKEQIKMMPK